MERETFGLRGRRYPINHSLESYWKRHVFGPILPICFLVAGFFPCGDTRGASKDLPEYFSRLTREKITSDKTIRWTQIGPGMSGYNEHFWIHPLDPETLFMSPDMGNSYRSTDGGASWHTVKDHDGDGTRFTQITAMDFSRQDGNFGLAVGNDDRTRRGVRIGIRAIYYTKDKGANWSRHPASDVIKEELSAVAFDPSDDRVIYLGAGDFWDVKRNHRTFENPHGEPGTGKIWKTADGGETWEPAHRGIHPDAQIGKIIVDPVYSSIVFAATTYGVYRSDTGGNSWKPVNRGLENGMARDLDLYYDPDNNQVILYAIDQVFWTPNGYDSIDSSGGVFKSDNRGKTWENITSNLRLDLRAMQSPGVLNSYYERALSRWFGIGPAEARARFSVLPQDVIQSFHRIAVDPTNPDKLYVLHNPKHGVSFIPGDVWTTDDGGAHWYACTRIGQGWNMRESFWESRNNPTERNMAFAHKHDQMIYRGNMHEGTTPAEYSIEGGRWLSVNPLGDVFIGVGQQLLRSRDGGVSWHQLDQIETVEGSDHWIGRGDSDLTARDVVTDPRIPFVYLVSIEHGLWRTTDDGHMIRAEAQAAMPFPNSPESIATLALHPENPNLLYALVYKQMHVGELRKSTDGGRTWAPVSKPIKDAGWGRDGNGNYNKVFMYSLFFDPLDDDTLYFCVPNTPKWTLTEIELQGERTINNQGIPTGIFKSTDSGKTWDTRNRGLPEGSSVSRLIPDALGRPVLYAAVLEHEGNAGGLFRSIDGAESWERLALPAPIEQVNHVHMNPTNGALYASAGSVNGKVEAGGAWVSRDDGETWSKIFHMPVVTQVASSPENPDRLMVIVAPGATEIGGRNVGIYLSENGGETWRKINFGLGQPNLVKDIKFDRNDSRVLWTSLLGSGWYKARLP